MHPYQLPYMEPWGISVAHPAMCNWPLNGLSQVIGTFDVLTLTLQIRLKLALQFGIFIVYDIYTTAVLSFYTFRNLGKLKKPRPGFSSQGLQTFHQFACLSEEKKLNLMT